MIFLQNTETSLLLWLLLVPIILIFSLVIVAVIFRVINYHKLNVRAKHTDSTDPEQQEIFFDAYGKRENIIDIQREMSRITVEVKNVDLVDTETLQELGAKGILISGNQIKASFGDRSKYVYSLMKGDE